MEKGVLKEIAWKMAEEESLSNITSILKQLTNDERYIFTETFQEAMEAIRARRRKEHEERMKELNEQLKEAQREAEEARLALEALRREPRQTEAYFCLLGEA